MTIFLVLGKPGASTELSRTSWGDLVQNSSLKQLKLQAVSLLHHAIWQHVQQNL